MKTETINWHELPQDGMPDAEATVLVSTDEREVDAGYFDGSNWRWCASGGLIDSKVLAWAEMPEGVRQ